MPRLTIHKITKGDTLYPVVRKLTYTDYDGNERPRDVAGSTIYFKMTTNDLIQVVYSSSATVASATAFTVDTSTDELIKTDHTLEVGDEVVLTTTGTLPAGLATSTTYFVIAVTQHRFQISVSIGGDAVNITDSGSGTCSYRPYGHVQYDFQAADVDEAGVYLAWFVEDSGGETQHYPPQDASNPEFTVQIFDAGTSSY